MAGPSSEVLTPQAKVTAAVISLAAVVFIAGFEASRAISPALAATAAPPAVITAEEVVELRHDMRETRESIGKLNERLAHLEGATGRR